MIIIMPIVVLCTVMATRPTCKPIEIPSTPLIAESGCHLVDHIGYRVLRVLHSLHVKALFVDFEKE